MYPDPVTKSAKTERKYSLSVFKQIDWPPPYKKISWEVAAPDEETVRRLNELAKKRPFGAYCKNKKYDTL